MKGRALALVAMCLSTSACFHQVVQTGLTPGPTVIDKPWTPFFLWGLVPPNPIDVSKECRTGIATVVTEQTFLNGLVSFIALLGVYSPRHITITCASGSSLGPGTREFYVGRNASRESRERVFAEAIEESSRIHLPVAIHF